MKVFGIMGWKNSGKTGLMERLISEFTARGLVVSAVKHAHHHFDVDQEGKDSHRHRVAGANEVLLSSLRRFALMHENRGESEPTLDELLAKLGPCDLALVEGYKRDSHPKIEAHRATTGNNLIAPEDPTVLAIASDTPLTDSSVPVFDLDDTAAIADFISQFLGLGEKRTTPFGDNCFALPAGVNWLPVDEALERLKKGSTCGTGKERVPVASASGLFLADDAQAARANPPGANSAVDGYAFAFDTIMDKDRVPLLDGRAAPGMPYSKTVLPGHAVRILTGALLPEGVDTVVLQEDVTVQSDRIEISALPKRTANTRKAGEDTELGATTVRAGTRLGPAEIGLLAATGATDVNVFKKLRIGVLSTGDELCDPGAHQDATWTYDANRPMLLSMIEAWGFEAVDLGRISDDRNAAETALETASGEVDVILTSGGASAGDEDHMSAVLREKADLQSWRIAVKPGRPLAIGKWDGTCVFALPGNPVAAFVCSLIFVRPALFQIAGGNWKEPAGTFMPAAFTKNKKAGRREYLRAMLDKNGRVEVFASEGSGRISGLAWATGLVELPDEAMVVRPGTMVKFLPYTAFGLD